MPTDPDSLLWTSTGRQTLASHPPQRSICINHTGIDVVSRPRWLTFRKTQLISVASSLGQLTSSDLFACEPSAPPVTDAVTATVTKTFTKVWEYTAWAACPTSEWPATYTVTEVCTGDPDTWMQPNIPPNFVKTVVTCGVCVEKTQTITCPVEEAARTGDVRIYGNGVTVTPAAVPAQPTGPGSGRGPDSMPGTVPGMGSGSSANSGPGANGAGLGPRPGAPAPGAGAGSSPHPVIGAGGDSPAVAPVPATNNNNGNAEPGSSPPAPNSGSGSGLGAAPAPAGGETGDPSPTMVMPHSNAGTDAASSPYVTAGAPSLKSSLLLVSGIFALVSVSIVCYGDI